MKIVLMSCGKSQILSQNASLYLDCRIMHNPYRDPVLGHLTGDDPKVQEWIKTQNANVIEAFMELIKTGISTLSTRDGGHRDPSKPFRICFFCLAGVHRSRGMKHVIAEILKAEILKFKGFDIEVI